VIGLGGHDRAVVTDLERARSSCSFSPSVSQWDTLGPASMVNHMDRRSRSWSLAWVAPGSEAAAPAEHGQVFRPEGDYWTIVYARTTAQLRDVVGLQYVAYLLARPHLRVGVEELLAAVRGVAAGDAERARSAVSKRIRDALRRIQTRHPALG
jgi:hypothetical protein